MAARLRANHQEDIKKKIQASQLVNRLNKHALGEVEMTSTQVDAAKYLLGKVVSNAPTQSEHTGVDGSPLFPSVINIVGA